MRIAFFDEFHWIEGRAQFESSVQGCSSSSSQHPICVTKSAQVGEWQQVDEIRNWIDRGDRETQMNPATLRLTAVHVALFPAATGCYKCLPLFGLSLPSSLSFATRTHQIMTDFEVRWAQKWAQRFGTAPTPEALQKEGQKPLTNHARSRVQRRIGQI
ncbi:MAG: hypothetical protein WA354_16290 [Terracidiphilus sp.]